MKKAPFCKGVKADHCIPDPGGCRRKFTLASEYSERQVLDREITSFFNL
jgi:hypothetical protein